MFVFRNMLTGELSEPFAPITGYRWPGGGQNEYVPKAAEHGDEIAVENDGQVTRHERVYLIVELPPTGSGSIDTPGEPTYDEEQDRVTRTHSLSAAPVTKGMVQAECQRRLAVGFEYDFGDERGVHVIATTDKDMRGWGEVTEIARSRRARSITTPITIATETGACQVSPIEWESVIGAAGDFRQPIWGASFLLQAQSPIPSDYTSDEHWVSS